MIEIEVEAGDWDQAVAQVDHIVTRAAQAALGTEAGDVVVLLTDDAAVRELNARFRDRDRPTNVLSFPAADSAFPHRGDLVLAFETCRDEAVAQGKSLADHLSHLVVHGVLHILGHDHEDEAEAEAMESAERTILAGIGVSDPYRFQNDR